MRRSSFPPKLQKFVNSVEKNAKAAGKSATLARIYGAWSACFVRYCTVNDRSWRDAKHIPVFLSYLKRRQDIDSASRLRAAESMVFLFEKLLKTDLGDPEWHPDRQKKSPSSKSAFNKSEAKTDEQGEQSTLLTRLLFHTSLPINEALDLCAGDVDLDAGLIYVSDPMGTPKQIIELPDALHEPLRRHLERLRKKHGRKYFDASLFQARALQGRKSNGQSNDTEDASETTSPESSGQDDTKDRPASLWGYAEES